MPVVEGVFVANFPLTLAEEQVDFVALNAHVLFRRALVERACLPLARRIGHLLADFGTRPVLVEQELGERLGEALLASARFGRRSARAELRALRAASPVTAAYEILDSGRFGEVARGGLGAIGVFLAARGHQSARNVVSETAVTESDEADPVLRAAVFASTAERSLHRNVLELVGEAVNLGRTSGALELATPPRYAMRSEQLDKRTCSPCSFAHGEIYEVDSTDYYGNLPPAGCLGGGRCRGVMVFADRIAQVRGTEPSDEELQRIREEARR